MQIGNTITRTGETETVEVSLEEARKYDNNEREFPIAAWSTESLMAELVILEYKVYYDGYEYDKLDLWNYREVANKLYSRNVHYREKTDSHAVEFHVGGPDYYELEMELSNWKEIFD